MKILVINAGSSSLKYQVFDMDTGAVIAKGLCDRIGVDGVVNATNVQINGAAADLILTETSAVQQVPVLGTVTLHA